MAVCLLGVAGSLPAAAELPMMTHKDWVGYYVGYKNKAFQFGITPLGETTLKVFGKKDESVSQKLTVTVNFVVEESMPGGKVITRKLDSDSLQSEKPASDKVENVVIKGRVGKDIDVEIYMDEDRGTMMLGGRIVNPGASKNPLKFAVQVRFYDAYVYSDRDTKKQIKAFEEKIQNDRMQIVSLEGKRRRIDPSESVDAKTVSGVGVKSMEMEFSTYQGRRFELTASENSAMHFSNKTSGPLYEGFIVSWVSDEVKDPQGKARLAIVVQ